MDAQQTAPAAEAFSMFKFIIAVLGSAVSMSFIKGEWRHKIPMGIGGVVLSYTGAAPAAVWLSAPADSVGLIGFLLAMLGMAFLARVFDAIERLDLTAWINDIWGAVKKRFGAGE